MNGELFDNIEKPPEGLSREQLKKWVRKHRDYPEMTLSEYMMLPTRDEYYELICAIPRETREGDKYRIGDDPKVGEMAAFMEFIEVKTELRKTEIAPAMDAMTPDGKVPLTSISMQLKACWIM